MSKISEQKALEAYPLPKEESESTSFINQETFNSAKRTGYIKGYDQAIEERWKPSKGQLECLEYAITKAEKDWSPLATNRIYLTLRSLKEQLEKLCK